MRIKDEDELPRMTKVLLINGFDPLYRDRMEIAAALIIAGWSKATVTRNFEAVLTMATIRFENERRIRQKKNRRATC